MVFKKLAGMALLGALSLSGCGEFEGVILSKTHEPARVWSEERPLVVTDGYRFSSGTGKILCIDDEDWVLEVGGRGRTLKKFYTSKENFNSVLIGQMYKQRPVDREEDNNIWRGFLRPGQKVKMDGKGVYTIR